MGRYITVLVSLSGLLALTGCAKATIYTRSGEIIEGRIKGSNATHVHIMEDRFTETRVERAQILDIDHPGRGLVLVGGIGSLIYLPSTAYFAATGWRSAQTGQSWNEGSLLLGMIPTTTLMVSMFVMGLSLRQRSVHATAPPVFARHTPPPDSPADFASQEVAFPSQPTTTLPKSMSWCSFLAVSP